MKNYILALGLFLSFAAPSHGQMTLATTFSGNWQYQIEEVNLSISGKKIAVVRGQSYIFNSPDTIFYYNMDYSLWKTIVCPAVPHYQGYFYFNPYGGAGLIPISYSSETLFNTDALLEVAVCYYDTLRINNKLLIINELGSIIESITNVAFEEPFAVHSVNASTFIATISTNAGPQVYNLPGTIPCDACNSTVLGLAKTEDKPSNILSSPIPNPSKNQVKITFNLPEGTTRGELTIYNTTGQLMKSYTVDNRFGFIMVDDSQFAPGMYYYNLTTNGTVSSTQKMVVIK